MKLNSNFQWNIQLCVNNVLCTYRQAAVLHSGVVDTERVDTQLTSLFVLQSITFGNCEGAVDSKNNTGDATNIVVTSNVAVVIASLCTVADVLHQKHGMQHIHPAVIYVWTDIVNNRIQLNILCDNNVLYIRAENRTLSSSQLNRKYLGQKLIFVFIIRCTQF